MKLLTLQVFFVIQVVSFVNGVNVATKLDFHDEHKPKIIERFYVTENDKNDNIEKIGVICASGGCNATKPTTATILEGSDSISADVVVEVKTTLNANDADKKKNKSSDEEIPDVPVVIGYGGAVSDRPNGHLNPHDNTLNPNPIVVTNFEQNFPELSHHVKNGNGFIPSLGVGIPQVNIEIKPHNSFQPLDNDGYNRYPNTYTKYYVDKPAHQPIPHWKSNNYGFVQRPTWNYRNPVPWYRRNSYPNNYDGSNYNYVRPTPPSTTWTTCVCHPNSVWTPTTPSYVNLNHPGKQINDKLAPLN